MNNQTLKKGGTVSVTKFPINCVNNRQNVFILYNYSMINVCLFQTNCKQLRHWYKNVHANKAKYYIRTGYTKTFQIM